MKFLLMVLTLLSLQFAYAQETGGIPTPVADPVEQPAKTSQRALKKVKKAKKAKAKKAKKAVKKSAKKAKARK